jgi:mono/diheme cytochrome c family protein
MRYLNTLFILSALLIADLAGAQAISDYDTAFIGVPLADPIMQHNKEKYVQYGCAYCHGMYLKPVGEATDLRASVIVGTDVNANLIGAILRVGIPQTPKSSPMPQFSDLSDQEIRAIASYIHYARAQENFKLLTEGPSTNGNAALGKAFFERTCSSCHSTAGDMGNKYNSAELRAQILAPTVFRSQKSFKLSSLNDADMQAARVKHQTLLENYKGEDVANVVAYLRSLK